MFYFVLNLFFLQPFPFQPTAAVSVTIAYLASHVPAVFNALEDKTWKSATTADAAKVVFTARHVLTVFFITHYLPTFTHFGIWETSQRLRKGKDGADIILFLI